MKVFQPYFVKDKYYEVLVWDPVAKKKVLVTFGDANSPGIVDAIQNRDPDMLLARDQYLASGSVTTDPTSPDYWIERFIWQSGDSYVYTPENLKDQITEPTYPAVEVTEMKRFQPVFVDHQYYQVLVWDPVKKAETLVTFGDQKSPEITKNLLDQDATTLQQRDQYLKMNPNVTNPTKSEYWVQRYIWLSGDAYDYTPEGKETYEIPIFPPENALDPPYSYPIIVNGAYVYPFDPYYSYYVNAGYPYYYNNGYYGGYGGYGAGAGLATGLVVGGLLGAGLGYGGGYYNGSYGRPNYGGGYNRPGYGGGGGKPEYGSGGGNRGGGSGGGHGGRR
jgi:hypothetical protein